MLSCVLTGSAADDGTYVLTFNAATTAWELTLSDGSFLQIQTNDVDSFVLSFAFVTSGETITTPAYPGGGTTWTGAVPIVFGSLDPDGETVTATRA